jgi:hypothetical protein
MGNFWSGAGELLQPKSRFLTGLSARFGMTSLGVWADFGMTRLFGGRSERRATV